MFRVSGFRAQGLGFQDQSCILRVAPLGLRHDIWDSRRPLRFQAISGLYWVNTGETVLGCNLRGAKLHPSIKGDVSPTGSVCNNHILLGPCNGKLSSGFRTLMGIIWVVLKTMCLFWSWFYQEYARAQFGRKMILRTLEM